MSTKISKNRNEKTDSYNGIDLIKFFCSILVFLLHYPPFENATFKYSNYLNLGFERYLCRIAVPFFFVCSGFFLFKKIELYTLNKERIAKYCFKLLQLSGIWHMLLVMGGTQHLWYLGSTVIAIIIFSLCLKYRMKFIHIWMLAIVLYIIGLLGDSYRNILVPIENISVFRYIFQGYEYFFQRTRNGIFMGFIFIVIGATFAYFKINIKKRFAVIGFVISMLCLLAEVVALNKAFDIKNHNMYIFLVPSVFFLFVLAKNIQLKDHYIYIKLRRIGVLVYFSQLFVYNATLLGMSYVTKFSGFDFSPYQSVISLAFTIIMSILIEWLSNKESLKWLQWLY